MVWWWSGKTNRKLVDPKELIYKTVQTYNVVTLSYEKITKWFADYQHTDYCLRFLPKFEYDQHFYSPWKWRWNIFITSRFWTALNGSYNCFRIGLNKESLIVFVGYIGSIIFYFFITSQAWFQEAWTSCKVNKAFFEKHARFNNSVKVWKDQKYIILRQ